jgi:hypothetical protein
MLALLTADFMDKESEARTVAAVDLGSTTFHRMVARLEETGHVAQPACFQGTQLNEIQ